LKTRFEDFVGAVEIQFDRLKEEIRQLKTKVSDSEKDLHTGDFASSKAGIPRSCHEARWLTLHCPPAFTGSIPTAKVLETIPFK
jgi:hypothetical protein